MGNIANKFVDNAKKNIKESHFGERFLKKFTII